MLPARLALLMAFLCGFLLTPLGESAQAADSVTWHGNQIRLYDVHQVGFTGKGVVVAVLDGWIDTSHPDFGGRVVQGADCTSGTCTTRMGRDDCGHEHGTHVAGTVTSSTYGVASRATLMPVRVLTSNAKGECTGDPDAVAAGIRWAVAHGARVVNLSLGPDIPGAATTTAIPSAVRDAASQGAVVVFSAGNADLPVAQSYGADALVVAATGPNGRLATYSQYGQGISVAAPGGQPGSDKSCSQATCVTSLYAGGRYAVAAGTSMAAPHVAGLAALIRARYPSWTGEQVRDRITATAHPLAGAGAGLVDAASALNVVVVKRTASATPRPTVRARTTSPARTATPAARPTTAGPVPTRSSAPVPTPTTPTPTPVVSAPVAAPPTSDREPVPVPLAAFAGALVGLAAAAVLVLVRR